MLGRCALQRCAFERGGAARAGGAFSPVFFLGGGSLYRYVVPEEVYTHIYIQSLLCDLLSTVYM